MGIKVNVSRYIEIKKKLEGVSRALVIPPNELKKIGETMAERIQRRTRVGKGIDGRSLAKLQPSYVEFRKKSKSLNRGLTYPSKSNLTFTGQLLNAMYVKVFTNNTFQIRINEKRIASNVRNSDIIKGQIDLGREFFGFSEAEKQELFKQLQRYYRRVLKV